ncbi:MAG: glycoside hydrolase family 127 protein [Candidatus Marinimicrobia bacterium]|nr:glycoside hydrolase family 127 protein [Candidatus Neomarinimicrobiota bacterium]
MRKILVVLLVVVLVGCTKKDGPVGDYSISTIDQEKVEITDGLWEDRISVVQNKTIPYGFRKCEEKGRMDNFLIAGGKMEGPVKGKMPFDDTDPYKVIEGASYALMNDYDPDLDSYLDSIINIISIGQEEDGYLTTWKTIDPQNSPAEWCPPGGRWENLDFSHELYNAGHLYHAAAAHYQATGKKSLLNIATKNADLINQVFGPEKLTIPPGHQIIETGLIRLYNITQKQEYLDLAKYFLELRGDSTTHELYGPYSQDHKPVVEQDEAVGHAVRAVYMYDAMTDIAAMDEDPEYKEAVHDIWNNIVNKKLHLTGGIGARHEGESFGDNYELPNLTAYCETCAAIGLAIWNNKMFCLTGDAKYIDILERSLYNGLISGLALEGTKFFYPNPLEADGEYKFNKGAITRKEWFDCSCCPTNLMRFMPSIPKYIYAREGKTLFVNLFIPNHTEISLDNTPVTITQKTEYPWEGEVNINIQTEEAVKFTMKVRIPGWSRNQPVPGDLYHYKQEYSGSPKIMVNGEEVSHFLENGYFTIDRSWESGDQVTVDFPMPVRQVIANQKVKADRDKLAFERGPVVYCAEEVDNSGNVFDFRIPEKPVLQSQFQPGLLRGLNVITAELPVVDKKSDKVDFTAIPYYSWSNRTPGKMRVWFPKY